MITFLTWASRDRGFLAELGEAAVVVEARHRRKSVGRQRRCVALRDQRIRIGRIADHQYAHVAARDRVERFALRREDLGVFEQQILALHAGAARPRADQHREIAVLERDAGIVRRGDLVEGGERAVVQFHHHALHGRRRRRYFQQIQVDRLISAEHLAGCDAKRERIPDVAGSACDGDGDWFFHDELPTAQKTKNVSPCALFQATQRRCLYVPVM